MSSLEMYVLMFPNGVKKRKRIRTLNHFFCNYLRILDYLRTDQETEVVKNLRGNMIQPRFH